MRGEYGERTKNYANMNLVDYESTHGKQPSRTPAAKYNPEKAMKEAERAYLQSKGIEKKTFWQKVKGIFKS